MREEKWKQAYRKIAKEIADELNKLAKSEGKGELEIIAELGYGKGKLANELLKIIKAAKFIAIDLAPQESWKINNERVFFIRGDARKLMLKHAKIDAFYSNFFVSWIEENELGEVFSEAYKALRSGGAIIVSDFIREDSNDVAKKIAIEQGKPENNLMPTNWHSISEVEKAMERAGFKEISYKRFSHEVRFSYSEAIEQLKLWHAKQEFIASVKPELKEHGMKLPDSYIIKGVKR